MLYHGIVLLRNADIFEHVTVTFQLQYSNLELLHLVTEPNVKLSCLQT